MACGPSWKLVEFGQHTGRSTTGWWAAHNIATRIRTFDLPVSGLLYFAACVEVGFPTYRKIVAFVSPVLGRGVSGGQTVLQAWSKTSVSQIYPQKSCRPTYFSLYLLSLNLFGKPRTSVDGIKS